MELIHLLISKFKLLVDFAYSANLHNWQRPQFGLLAYLCCFLSH